MQSSKVRDYCGHSGGGTVLAAKSFYAEAYIREVSYEGGKQARGDKKVAQASTRIIQ